MQAYKTPRIQDYDGDLSRRWYIQYSYRHPDTQKFVVFREWVSSKHTTRTARYVAAKELRDSILKKLNMGYDPFTAENVRVPIIKALMDVVEVKSGSLRKRTAHTYSSIANLFCEWLKKNGYEQLMPHQITRRIAQAYFDDAIVKEKISPRTHNNRLLALRTLFNVLAKREFLESNVFNKLDMVQLEEPAIRAYTNAEKVLIKNALQDQRPELWLAAMLVYYCFLRPQEMCRLRIGNIDFDTKTLLIDGTQSKNKKTRSIMIPDPLHNILLQMNYQRLPKSWYIFSNGRKLSPGTKEIAPNRIFNAWQEHVMIPLGINKTIYLFKHTGAGELFESGADPRNIQLQLRHGSLEEALAYLEKFSKRPNESLRKYFNSI